MFVPYSSDHCIEFRPWMAYILFPVIVAGSFAVIADGGMPETNSIIFLFYDVFGVAVVAYMIGTCFALWTFGKAVCAKTGNCLYVVSIFVSLVLGLLIFERSGESIWLLNWVVQCLAGLFLVFCPLNSVDCFIYLPPFRSFSINGTLAVFLWLIYDFICCLFLGWTGAAFLHPFSFMFGILLGTIYLLIPFVGGDLGDITLWQWIRGIDPDQDLAWEESWSAKKERLRKEQEDKERRVESLKEREQEFLHQLPRDDTIRESIDVLCQCGEIVHIAMTDRKEALKCPHCHHPIHVSQM